jgi:hypothetical protein
MNEDFVGCLEEFGHRRQFVRVRMREFILNPYPNLIVVGAEEVYGLEELLP